MRVGGAIGFLAMEVPYFVQKTGMTAVQVQYPTYLSTKPNWQEHPQALETWKLVGHNLDLYVHAPFNLNPCDSKRHGWFMKNYLDCCEFATTLGAKGIVLHPGSRKELEMGEARENLLKFMHKVCTRTDMVTLLETDAGSKKNTKVGSPDFLWGVCNRLNSEKVQICIDTEHLFARGIDMWDGLTRGLLLEQLRAYVKLVHLNVPDPEVSLGSFLDRHSIPFDHDPRCKPPLDDCVTFYANRTPIPMILDLVGKFPCILERGPEAQTLDMLLIHSLLGI